MKRLLSIFFILTLLVSFVAPVVPTAVATITSTTASTSAVGDGVEDEFTFSWYVINETDVIPYLDDTVQDPADYTVVLNPSNLGGTVTFDTAPGDGVVVLINRETDRTQELDLPAYGAFAAEDLEAALDKLTLLMQEAYAYVTGQLYVTNWKSDWETVTAYVERDLVIAPNGSMYLCIEDHTSGTWSTDLAAGYWNLAFDVSGLSGVPDGGTTGEVLAKDSATDQDFSWQGKFEASGEIDALTEKTAPVSADLVVVEDSAASNAKKKVQLGNLLATHPYKARAYLNSAQTINTGTETKIELDGETYDENNNFDSTTDNDYTAPVTGWYLVIGQVGIDDIDDGDHVRAVIKVDGVQKAVNRQPSSSTSAIAKALVTDIIKLTAGEVVTLHAYHNEGATQNLRAVESETFLSVHLISN